MAIFLPPTTAKMTETRSSLEATSSSLCFCNIPGRGEEWRRRELAAILQTFKEDLLGVRHLDVKMLQEEHPWDGCAAWTSMVIMRLRGGTALSRGLVEEET